MSTQNIKAVWLEYPRLNRAFGGGGWSRHAKNRPAPERREVTTTNVVFTTGKSVIVDGQRKLKVNLFKASTGEVIRADYPTTDELTSFGLTPRQVAARARVAAQKRAAGQAAADKVAAEKQTALSARLAAVCKDGLNIVAAWVKDGCVHPAPAEVMQAKVASGLSWTEFQKGGAL
jgi:hypothetical protein